ncbi:hypothetical protein BDZ94DRAFT_1310408 [Collybia nuda]|uniref:Uncharacterized protein n=1 Tax=Collybia nuda TaxID=64659 RepID=A0A9P5Y5H4_9AGAR|nr:hypothetical protein BDZ94DRAFT_1310408 [Collybia nuda]
MQSKFLALVFTFASVASVWASPLDAGNTNCFTPSGGGPDPNECHIITDALKFESQNTGQTFTIGTGQHHRHELPLLQDFLPEQGLKRPWASLADIIAFSCQAPQNAHGGNCVAADQRWLVQDSV